MRYNTLMTIAALLIIVFVISVICISCQSETGPVNVNPKNMVPSCLLELETDARHLVIEWQGIHLRGFQEDEIRKFREQTKKLEESLNKLSKALDEIEKQEEARPRG